MITIPEIAELITKHPNDMIFYIIDTGKIFNFPYKDFKKISKDHKDTSVSPNFIEALKAVEDEKTNFLILPRFSKKDLNKIVDEFVLLHQKDYCKDIESMTIAQINKRMLSDPSFKDCWINFFCDVTGSNFLMYFETFKIKEDEASPELYKRVLDLLKEFKKGHYEKIFSDNHVFKIMFNDTLGDDALCTIMGNAGITNGISFFIHDKCTAMRNLINRDNSEFDDYYVPTLTFLGKQLTFYFEDECSDATDDEKYGKLNPFGEDDSITSFVAYLGSSYHCYLTTSMAHASIRYLTKLLQGMKDFVKKAKKLNLDIASYEFVIDDNNSYVVPEYIYRRDFLEDLPIHFPPFESIGSKDKITIHSKEKWDFVVRLVPGVYLSEANGRICNWVYYFCFFNHDSGEVVHFEMVPPSFMDCLTPLNEKLIATLNKIGLAKTIYCSNIFDAGFLAASLGPDKRICGKIDIIHSLDIKEEVNDLSETLIEEFDKEPDA